MNPGCGWCTKADPIVAELVKKGHKITTLDITKPKDAERANEVKAKHNAQCGTPLFIDGKSGNMVCGLRQDVLEKWASGEEIPAPPPRPQQQRPTQPQQQQQQQQMGPQLTKFEYIWTDGFSPKNIRSKTKYMSWDRSTIKTPSDFINSVPEWSYDGSSTNQADTGESDCVLKPIKIVPNTIENGRTPSFIVLCEVMNPDGTPHTTNTRAKLLERVEETSLDDMWFSVEQELVMMDPITNKPIGWSEYEDDTPPPQGNYYCGVGSDVVIGRDLMDNHAIVCNKAGILVAGTNAEVMLSQWEYQTEPKPAIQSADNLIISRFLLQRMAEKMNIAISYEPKPVGGDWNGSGAHINFSTKFMREHADMDYMNLICSSMGKHHDKSIEVYGIGNDKRLTGNHETSSIDKFSWGELDRTASIRIPMYTVKNEGMGYLEDRRPAANIDPYEAFTYLLGVTNNINEELFIAT
tara:strand:- start:1856 stop:3250 length:1395 start_codon:yes stop_codon:yes gene_type:complete